MPSRLSTNKEIAELLNLAHEQDWDCKRLGNGHIEWVNPEGEAIYTSTSPSDHRFSIVKIKHALKTAGLIIEKAEWQRVKRERRQRDKELDAMVKAVGDAFIKGEFVTKGRTKGVIQDTIREEEDIARLYQTIDPATGEFVMRCPCGKHLLHPQGYITHVKKCPVYLETEGNMDRNVNEPPPLEQRLDCPDCGQWYWINQGDHLERHMRSLHGKVKCYTCGKWLSNRSMYRHQQTCLAPEVPQPVVPIIDVSDAALAQHQRDIAAASERAAEAIKEFATPSRAYDDSRVGAIATPAELERLTHPPELEKPAATNGTHKPVPEAEPEPDMTKPENVGITDRIRKVMAEVGRIDVGDDDLTISATTKLHELVGLEYSAHSLQSIVGQLARRGEIIRDMSSPRRARSLTWAAASLPPEPPTRQETPVPVASVPQRAESSPPATVTTINRGPDVSDDDLWTLLEMVLSEPVQLNRENYSVINDWMNVTRRLFQMRSRP